MPRHTNKTNAQRAKEISNANLTAVTRAAVNAQRMAASAVVSARSAHVSSGRALTLSKNALTEAKNAKFKAQRAIALRKPTAKQIAAMKKATSRIIAYKAKERQRPQSLNTLIKRTDNVLSRSRYNRGVKELSF